MLRRALREAAGAPNPFSRTRFNAIWNQFDQGTQRAILRLHRSTPEEVLIRAGAGLEQLQVPTLVVWGERDPWWDRPVLDAYMSRLPEARVERLPNAGHWPWLDDPRVADLVADFLRPRPGESTDH